ncbi:MAG: hypothetical protein FJX80_05760 [Bacteroidetes bacterium]|nr:hypothetical protein [Bacteroidota bacterium]
MKPLICTKVFTCRFTLILSFFIYSNVFGQKEQKAWELEFLPARNEIVSSNLLIIGDDRSGSTSTSRKLTLDEYKSILDAFQQKYGGTVAVRVIGNPINNQLEFIRFKPKPTYRIPDITPIATKHKLTLTGRAEALEAQRKLEKSKDLRNKENQTLLNNFLSQINSNIINYKPKGKDLTDIIDFFSHLSLLISEPQYKNKNVTIILLSDGIHDASKSKVSPINLTGRVSLHLIGWKDKTVFAGNPKLLYYESKDGLLESINEVL